VVTIGFDTATAATTVAALRDGETLFSAAEDSGGDGRPRHAVLLLPLIERAADACGGWEQVDRVAVGVGPGTFTGIRIGVVTARALASAHRCGLSAIETTRAVGARAARAAGRDACAVIDGKRGEVFASRVAPDGQPVWGPVVSAPADLAARLDAEGFDGPLAGDGVDLHAEALIGVPGRHRADQTLDRVDAEEICRLASTEPPREPANVMPLYLRRPDAERWVARDG
jgi:tRNA threonylcarbamoyladenosine biosynthesis protein TsaB